MKLLGPASVMLQPLLIRLRHRGTAAIASSRNQKGLGAPSRTDKGPAASGRHDRRMVCSPRNGTDLWGKRHNSESIPITSFAKLKCGRGRRCI